MGKWTNCVGCPECTAAINRASKKTFGKTSTSVHTSSGEAEKKKHRSPEDVASSMLNKLEKKFEGGSAEYCNPSSKCRDVIHFAKDIGIKKHPELYPGLTELSSFHDVREFFAKQNKGDCGCK